MAKKDIRRQELFDCYKNNLNLLCDNGLISVNKDVYYCPICRIAYSKLDKADLLTFEDAPPKELDGSYNTLTCKKCNNEAGSKIDSHLVKRLKEIDVLSHMTGTSGQVFIETDFGEVNARLLIGKDNSWQIKMPIDYNKPSILNAHIESVKSESGKNINLRHADLKIDYDRLDYAVAKTAYILIFERLGYLPVFLPFLDRIRLQIRYPESRIIGKSFWGIAKENKLKDGVYLLKNVGIESLTVVFSASTNKSKYKFIVFFPIRENDLHKMYYTVSERRKSEKLDMELIEGSVYLENIDNINHIKDWISSIVL